MDLKSFQKKVGSILKSNNDRNIVYLLTIILVLYICFVILSKKQIRDLFILVSLIASIYYFTKDIQISIFAGLIASLLLNYFLDSKESFSVEYFDDKISKKKKVKDDEKDKMVTDTDEKDEDDDDDEDDNDEDDNDEDDNEDEDDQDEDEDDEDDQDDDDDDDDEKEHRKKVHSKKKKNLKKKKEYDDDSDDDEDHVRENYLDMGESFKSAYKNLSKEQLGGLSFDTKELMKTQKGLINTLQKMGPALQQGKEVMATFENFFNDNKI